MQVRFDIDKKSSSKYSFYRFKIRIYFRTSLRRDELKWVYLMIIVLWGTLVLLWDFPIQQLNWYPITFFQRYQIKYKKHPSTLFEMFQMFLKVLWNFYLNFSFQLKTSSSLMQLDNFSKNLTFLTTFGLAWCAPAIQINLHGRKLRNYWHQCADI